MPKPFFIRNIQLTKKELEYMQYILSVGFKISQDIPKKEWNEEYKKLAKLKQIFNVK